MVNTKRTEMTDESKFGLTINPAAVRCRTKKEREVVEC